METLNVCPSTLAEGFNTYSPTARKLLFDGREVSHILLFDSPNNELPQDDIKIVLSGIRHILATIVFQLLIERGIALT